MKIFAHTLKFVLVGFFFFSLNSYAQSFPKPDASPMDLAIARGENQKIIARIIYSRPQKKGREIFGKLVPYNKLWRTGANEASEIDLYIPVQLDNHTINTGTYSLFTIPRENEWDIILNTKTNIWGTDHDKTYDVLCVTVPSRKSAAPIESLSMAFRKDEDGISLMIGWDDRYVEVPMKFITEED